jgi:hypothetical protein
MDMEEQQAEIATLLKRIYEALDRFADIADGIAERLPPRQPITAGPDGFNRQKYFNLLYENPIEAQKYAMQFVLGAPVEDFMRDYQTVRTGSLAGMENMVNAQFAQKHPELLEVSPEDDIHNAETISKILVENGWTYNLNNLEAAYAVAKMQGKLKLQADPTTEEESLRTTAEEEEEFSHNAPLNKVKQYLGKKYPSLEPALTRLVAVPTTEQNKNPEREGIHLGPTMSVNRVILVGHIGSQ